MLKYYDEIMGYTQRLTGDKTLAQDLTQETYAKVLEASKKSNRRCMQIPLCRFL